MKRTKKRLGGIDILKHILAVSVIFIHMNSESRYSSDTKLLISEIVKYIEGAVVGFFLISGFFFSFKGSLIDNIRKIFKRTMFPFFIFSISYSILLYLIGKGSLEQGLINTITFHGSTMQLYFLPYLFAIYTFYLLFFKLFDTNKYFVCLLISLIIAFLVISIGMPTITLTGSDVKLIPIYTLSFGIGIILNIKKTDTLEFNYINSLIIIGFLFLISLYDYRYIHIGVMIFLINIANYISLKFKILNKEFPGSGGVYLLHTPIVNFGVSVVLVMLGILEQKNLFYALVATYIITVSITITFNRFFPKHKFLLLE